jgi:aspartate racemase
MKRGRNKTIGIVGGMGPEAGNMLFYNILKHTPAASDQEHLPVILMSFPGEIEDRTAFCEGRVTVNPAFRIAAIILQLEKAGAEVAGIACNSSHIPAIYDVIQDELAKAQSSIQLLHLPGETVRYLKHNYPQVRKVGLMTTNGTYRSRLYYDLLVADDFEVIMPDPVFQDTVIHNIIYNDLFGIKANAALVTPDAALLAEKALQFFQQQGAEAVILGCTELSFIQKMTTPPGMILIDSGEALAKALINASMSHHTINLLMQD